MVDAVDCFVDYLIEIGDAIALFGLFKVKKICNHSMKTFFGEFVE